MIDRSGSPPFVFVAAALICALVTFGTARAESPAAEPARPSFLTLRQAFETALRENEQVKISRQDLVNARTDITVATSNLYPQLSLRAAHTRLKDTDLSSGADQGGAGLSALGRPDHYNTLSLQLDQHIYQWGKVWMA